ncbi:MAG: 3',5'-cyclic-AMP phosphodiesterase [Methylococcaceae bacterium]|jgi:Icc protein
MFNSPAPEPPSGHAIQVLQLTDFHFKANVGDRLLGIDTELSFRDTLATALRDHPQPDLALLTGDLVQDASPMGYQRLGKSLNALPCPAYCLPGNHDDPALLASALAGGKIHAQAQILVGAWQIICLNSSVPQSPRGLLADSELTLLSDLLGQEPERFALIALHHHPIASGSAWMDTMQLENSKEFFDVLGRYPRVKGAVFGHVHQEMDAQHQGLRIMGTPSTCFQFKPGQTRFTLDVLPPGYRWLELYESGEIRSSVARAPSLPPGFDPTSAGY